MSPAPLLISTPQEAPHQLEDLVELLFFGGRGVFFFRQLQIRYVACRYDADASTPLHLLWGLRPSGTNGRIYFRSALWYPKS